MVRILWCPLRFYSKSGKLGPQTPQYRLLTPTSNCRVREVEVPAAADRGEAGGARDAAVLLEQVALSHRPAARLGAEDRHLAARRPLGDDRHHEPRALRHRVRRVRLGGRALSRALSRARERRRAREGTVPSQRVKAHTHPYAAPWHREGSRRITPRRSPASPRHVIYYNVMSCHVVYCNGIAPRRSPASSCASAACSRAPRSSG